MNEFKWRKLKQNETIAHGDIIAPVTYNMNSTVAQMDKWVDKHNHIDGMPPMLEQAHGLIGEFVHELDDDQAAWRLVLIKDKKPKTTPIALPEDRLITFTL